MVGLGGFVGSKWLVNWTDSVSFSANVGVAASRLFHIGDSHAETNHREHQARAVAYKVPYPRCLWRCEDGSPKCMCLLCWATFDHGLCGRLRRCSDVVGGSICSILIW